MPQPHCKPYQKTCCSFPSPNRRFPLRPALPHHPPFFLNAAKKEIFTIRLQTIGQSMMRRNHDPQQFRGNHSQRRIQRHVFIKVFGAGITMVDLAPRNFGQMFCIQIIILKEILLKCLLILPRSWYRPQRYAVFPNDKESPKILLFPLPGHSAHGRSALCRHRFYEHNMAASSFPPSLKSTQKIYCYQIAKLIYYILQDELSMIWVKI